MATDSPPLLTFEVFRGTALIKRAELTEPSITIGSGPSALLPVDDPQLAELHAVLNVEDDGTISVLDLGSDTGIVYNGERISQAHLKSGDTFSVGTLSFRLLVGAGAASGSFDDFDDEDATYVAPSMAALQQQRAEEAAAAAAETTDAAAAAPPPAAPVPAPVPAAAEPPPSVNKLDIHQDGDEDDDEDHVEDVMDFIMRSGTAQSGLGVNKKRPKVLEVNQIWGEVLLDTKHFSQTHGNDVSIGSEVGYKWHFLGIDMGWIPSPLRMVLPYTPPMWSEVSSTHRDDFHIPDHSLPNDAKEHVLFSHKEDSYIARVSQDWDGFADIEDQRYSFDELVANGKASKEGSEYVIPVGDDVRLMVDVQGVIFFTHQVHAGARMIDRSNEDPDYPLMAIFSFIGFLGVMFGVIMYFSPKPAANEMVEIPDRFVELLLEKQEEDKKDKKKPKANPDAGEGAKAKKEEGKVGKKDAKMEKAKGNKVEVKKQELDRQIAENAGILGALRDAGELDGVFGSSGLDANLTGGVGGLIGAKGTQIGAGGLGARGSGLGGGGTAEGLGGLGTKGIGSGKSGYGAGGGNFGAKGEGGIGTIGGDPIILGALDRSLIDEVIKRHMNQIRYCYQRELTKNPALGGKIVIKFVIAKDGSVSSASKKTSTMNNSSVESCVVSRFMRMQFPEPKGGGIVIVSYPFIFSPG